MCAVMKSAPFVALVTGGLYGIGSAIVEQFRAQEWYVYVLDLLDETHPDVRALMVDENVQYIAVDLADEKKLVEAFSRVWAHQKRWRERPAIDVLVNNAGICRDGLAVRLSYEDWREVMRVNLDAAFLCAQQVLPEMMRQKKGYIISISSVAGLFGSAGQANYAASKAGLVGLTKSLAREYGSRGIVVNAIAPGCIETAMLAALPEGVRERMQARISLGRFGDPHDIAHMVLFLTSGKADYITGQVIQIDGGMA